MRQFEIAVENKIGCLADVTEILAQARINLKAIATDNKDTHGVIKIVTDDDDATRQVLKEAGLNYKEHEIVPIRVLDKPGELAKVAKAMSNLNIDIESVFLMDRDQGTAHIAFKVDDLTKARELLK